MCTSFLPVSMSMPFVLLVITLDSCVRPLELAHIFKSVVFGKDGKGISFKNRLKWHINWQKVRNLNVI